MLFLSTTGIGRLPVAVSRKSRSCGSIPAPIKSKITTSTSMSPSMQQGISTVKGKLLLTGSTEALPENERPCDKSRRLCPFTYVGSGPTCADPVIRIGTDFIPAQAKIVHGSLPMERPALVMLLRTLFVTFTTQLPPIASCVADGSTISTVKSSGE